MKTKVKVREKIASCSEKINVEMAIDDINRVIETLLFANSVNIGADWDEKESESIINLAITLKEKLPENSLKLDNLTYYEDENLTDPWTQKIQQNFSLNQFKLCAFEL